MLENAETDILTDMGVFWWYIAYISGKLEKTIMIIEKRKEKKIYGTFTTFSYRSNKEDVQVRPDFK